MSTAGVRCRLTCCAKDLTPGKSCRSPTYRQARPPILLRRFPQERVRIASVCLHTGPARPAAGCRRQITREFGVFAPEGNKSAAGLRNTNPLLQLRVLGFGFVRGEPSSSDYPMLIGFQLWRNRGTNPTSGSSSALLPAVR